MSDNLYSCGVIYRIKNTNEFLVGRVTGARNGVDICGAHT